VLDKYSSKVIFSENQFNEWTCLNDTIMGGSSSALCTNTPQGLLLRGELVDINGGFISCRSQLFNPPLNLNSFLGLQLKLDAQGRTLKLALSIKDSIFGIKEIAPAGLRWVTTFPTEENGSTIINIPFVQLRPNIRAKKVNLPVSFNSRSIFRIQLLYSKFGDSGKLNPNFTPGPFQLLLRSINAYK